MISVLDNMATEVAQYRYNSFGKLVAKAGSFEQPFQFSTKRYDAGTGLNYYGYRFYSPGVERWMNRDPLGEAGGVNLYGFVGGNPVNWVDPWGLEIIPFVGDLSNLPPGGYPGWGGPGGHVPSPSDEPIPNETCWSQKKKCQWICNGLIGIPCTIIGIGAGIGGGPEVGIPVGIGCRGAGFGTCYLACMGADDNSDCDCE